MNLTGGNLIKVEREKVVSLAWKFLRSKDSLFQSHVTTLFYSPENLLKDKTLRRKEKCYHNSFPVSMNGILKFIEDTDMTAYELLNEENTLVFIPESANLSSLTIITVITFY